MLHPLEQKIVALRRRVRRLAAVYGLSIVAAILLATVAVLGSIDCLLRLEDRGLRIIASLARWPCWRGVAAASSARPCSRGCRTPIWPCAFKRRFPRLNDGLLSAVEFLGQSEDDPTAGSAALRRAVIAQAAAETQDLDFSDVLDRRPATRAAGAAGRGVLAGEPSSCWLAPADAQVAVARLINPLGQHRLAADDPSEDSPAGGADRPRTDLSDRSGRRLRRPAAAGGPHPLSRRSPDGGVIEETEPMRFVDGAMVARRENVQRPFSYRVEGGDDRSMPWSEVEVVEPPAVESLSIRLIPPAYTGWPAAQSATAHPRLGGHARCDITGQATKPLAAADLCLEGGRKIPARARQRRRLVHHRLRRGRLRDREVRRLLVRVDRPRRASRRRRRPLGNPRHPRRPADACASSSRPPISSSRRGPSCRSACRPRTTSPCATSRWRSAAASRSRNTSCRSSPARSSRRAQPGPNPAGDSRMVDYRWDLAPLDLQPGTQVTFYATASDYLPQIGQERAAAADRRHARRVAAAHRRPRKADRGRIAAGVDDAAGLPRRRSSRSRSGWPSCGDSSRPTWTTCRPPSMANARWADCSPAAAKACPCTFSALLADLENNRIDSADARRQMAALLAELDRLGREHLPPMDHELTAAVKTAQVDREGQGRRRPAAARQASPHVAGRRRPSTRTRSSPRWSNGSANSPAGTAIAASTARSGSCSTIRRTSLAARRRWAAAR